MNNNVALEAKYSPEKHSCGKCSGNELYECLLTTGHLVTAYGMRSVRVTSDKVGVLGLRSERDPRFKIIFGSWIRSAKIMLGSDPRSEVVLFVCSLVHGLRKPWGCRLTKDFVQE